ncbi:MAG: hypothetical protein HKN49_01775 [Gammaproteobacteria bacterium]|nr:hypothetical protein [Gammaproteobacteria bacterium]
MAKDPWHYPRKALATKFISQLDTGLAPRLTLVAPRRKGKTEFLVYDLAPAAEKAGYRVVYASLWANVNAPQLGLLEALSLAVEAKQKRRSVAKTVLGAAVQRVKIEALSVGAELEFADTPVRVTTDEISQIDRLIDELASGRRTKLLLILDEIQHLVTEEAFAPLVYGLRTTLDRLRQVRVVFSGSSRGGIRRMFGDQNAPFFGFSTEVELPDLDERFTAFLAKVYGKITNREIDPQALWKPFVQLDRNPFYIREALKLMALEPGLKPDAAIKRLLVAVAEQNDYAGVWSRLPKLDRALFLEISENPGSSGLHGSDKLERFSAIMGKPVSRTLVARRLQRLVDQNLVSATSRGAYQVELPGFADWVIRHHGDED